ncbi:hypothetical protein F503_01532 [Ophiostoma piceae UAMH 11346]|uniref:Uncharacterized protein n=1 Tax=Ophiostoma piceae (strain UAMH 11346) TaxID=1262450 RepID=S3BUV6_OPHP1|nr:hypothetical protein F503_01532 [Ophiostoma piceae UAMH 11346]
MYIHRRHQAKIQSGVWRWRVEKRSNQVPLLPTLGSQSTRNHLWEEERAAVHSNAHSRVHWQNWQETQSNRGAAATNARYLFVRLAVAPLHPTVAQL